MTQCYRIKNWSDYNRSLIQRGSINFWFSEDAIKKWITTEETGEKGRPQVYSDDAIICALVIRSVYSLPLRALEGFLTSLFCQLGLPIKAPSYTQISRRAKQLGKQVKRVLKSFVCSRIKSILFDSTGLKVYGEGEWKVRQHGISKRRTWRKLHLGVDPDTHYIVVCETTSNGVGAGDGEVGERMIKEIPKRVKEVFGDGSYDGIEFRRSVVKIGAKAIIPPPRDAVVHEDTEDVAMINRNNAVKEICGLGGDEEGRKIWKKLKGYHTRSLAETAMYRIKQLTGEKLRSREWERQCVEGDIKCLVVNMMTSLGMPEGEWIEVA